MSYRQEFRAETDEIMRFPPEGICNSRSVSLRITNPLKQARLSILSCQTASISTRQWASTIPTGR